MHKLKPLSETPPKPDSQPSSTVHSLITLERYNEIRELLIEKRTTGLQGNVGYWDRDWRVSVIREAVHMRVNETGVRRGHRGTYNWSPSQECENRYA